MATPDPERGPPPVGRRRLPDTRAGRTHKFTVQGFEGYITANTYEDGSLGELFLTEFGKEGSTTRGLMSALAMMTSLALQHGVPVDTIARKFAHMQFAPNGPTGNRQIPFAKSLVDYIGRWIASQFGDSDLKAELGVRSAEAANPPPGALSLLSQAPGATGGDVCADCGGTVQRTGTCMACSSCGWTSGCG